MAKVLKECRLKSLDGVKDVKFGKASVENRRMRQFAKNPPANSTSYDDVKAREEMYGPYYF